MEHLIPKDLFEFSKPEKILKIVILLYQTVFENGKLHLTKEHHYFIKKAFED